MVAGVVTLAAAAAVLWAPTAPPPTGRELPLAGQAPAATAAALSAPVSSPSAYFGDQPAAAPAAEGAAAAVVAETRAEPDRMLIARESGLADSATGNQTSAFAGSGQPAPQGSASSAGYNAPQEQRQGAVLAVARSGDLARPGSVRYGTGDRAELMGRGAGPVYNLKSNRAVHAGAVPDMGAIIQQAATIIEGARGQIEKSALDPKSKAQALSSLHSAEAGLPGR